MQTKICQACGRSFENRKKWREDWDQVKYCSAKCRGFKAPELLKRDILQLLATRERGKTICPSEVLPPEYKKNKIKMERVRSAARILVHEGKIEITQKGRAVDPDSFRGPIRLRLK